MTRFRRNITGIVAGLLVVSLVGSALADPPPGFEALSLEENVSENLAVSAQILPPTQSEPARLQISASVFNGWHIYSITQKPRGPNPTLIRLLASVDYRHESGPLTPVPQSFSGPFRFNDYELTGPFTAAPAPSVRHIDDIWPGLPIEEHQGEVTWTAPIRLGPNIHLDRLAISGDVKAQLCREGECVVVSKPFTARQAISPPPGVAAQVVAKSAGPPPSPGSDPSAAPVAQPTFRTKYLALTGQLDAAAVAPGTTASLTFSAVPEKSWHLYALADREPENLFESKPTLFAVTERGGLKVGRPTADRPIKEKKRDFDPPLVDHYYTGAVTFTLPIEVPAGTSPGRQAVSGTIGFQTCSDDGKCDTPTGARFEVTVDVAAQGRAGTTPVSFTPTSYQDVAKTAAAQPAWDVVAGAALAVEVASDSVQLQELAVNLVLAFFGGLILNAMPCVLPVIGLKIMSFVEQAGESRHRVFVLNAWFTIGVVSVFLALAALVAFTSLGWSGQFQQIGFKIPLAAIVFVFALSLLGIWEIPLPGFVGSHAAHQVAEREGVTGALAKGILSTVLATPCVGPFMAGPLTWTSTMNSAPLTFAIFGMMGLGMASPYLVIGAFPSLVRYLPKPGAWMETFKHLMGFVLLATVVWIFWTIPPRYFIATLALLFGLWMACWWIGRTPLTAELGDKLTAWGTAILIAAAVGIPSFKWLVDDAPSTTQLAAAHGVWRPYTPQALEELRAQRVPVLVDFTAKWCLTCQANKFTALHTKATEEYMKKHGIVGLIADKTDDAPDVDQLLINLGHKSKVLPFYAVYPADGGTPITYKHGPLLQGTLLKMLEQAGNGPEAAADEKTAMKPVAER